MRFQNPLKALLLATVALIAAHADAQSGSAASASNAPEVVAPGPVSAAPAAAGAGSASSSSAGAATVGEVSTLAPTPAAPTTAAPTAAPTLAPIASAAPGSSTFQLVPNKICPDIVVDKIDAIYTKNRAIFDECVADAEYQIYPHSGSHPTTKQIHAMATSPACVAIFMAVVLANFPTCDLGGMPLKSVTETLLKIKVDIDEGREAASEERFQQLMYWRRDVNLAQEAGVPFDGNSTLYLEYKTNLAKALAGSAVRVGSDLTLEYQLANGTYTRGDISFLMLQDSGDNGSDGEENRAIGTVRPASSANDDSSGSAILVRVSSDAAAALGATSTWLAVSVAGVAVALGSAW